MMAGKEKSKPKRIIKKIKATKSLENKLFSKSRIQTKGEQKMEKIHTKNVYFIFDYIKVNP